MAAKNAKEVLLQAKREAPFHIVRAALLLLLPCLSEVRREVMKGEGRGWQEKM